VLIVAGLYSVLWGKYKEIQEKDQSPIPLATKSTEADGQGGMASIGTGEEKQALENPKNVVIPVK